MKKSNLHIERYFRFLITAAFIFCGVISVSAKPESKKQHLFKDSSYVQLKQPSQSAQDSYYSDDYWRYQRDKKNVKQEPDVFDRLWNSFWEKLLNSVQSRKDGSFNPWNILWIVLFVTLVVLVILRLTSSGVSSVFSGKRKDVEETDATLEDVDIHGINYEEQIRSAIARNDYRLAIRLWFLRTLKSFSDKELVNWKIDKTNSDYYYELSGTNYQQEFGDVSKLYDYIWYGEFPVDENSYRKAEEKFHELNKKLE